MMHGVDSGCGGREVATAKVTDACYPRHLNDEFLRFLKQIAKAYPVKMHIVVNNYATDKYPNVQTWLAQQADHAALHPHVRVVAEPGRDLLGIITRQAIRHGALPSVKDLIGAIEVFIEGWNGRCEPFVWTKTADQIPHSTPGHGTSIAHHALLWAAKSS
jgi:hypothetical protein